MTIGVDWGTKIISVYKVDMTLIQASPIEIYELDLNIFRLALKDLEDDEEGMPHLDTHRHVAPIDVGSITLARVVEIINSYTITFEDGQYAVNLIGANSNLADNVNVNQVSVRASNSAGLVTSAGIEAIEYSGGVYIDVDNGESGSVYPIGTLRRPVDNLTDALVLANARGFKKLFILESMEIDAGSDISEFVIEGRSQVNTVIDITSLVDCENVEIFSCNITGILDSGVRIVHCTVGNVTYVNGFIENSGLYGTVVLGGSEDAVFNNCYQSTNATPEIDMGGTGQDLIVANYSGNLNVSNSTGVTNICAIGLSSGSIILDSTITNGMFILAGVGVYTDNATSYAALLTSALINTELISDSVWDELAADHVTASTFGAVLADILADTGTSLPTSLSSMDTKIDAVDTVVDTIEKLTGYKVTKSGDVITIYESNGTDVWRQYDLTSGGRVQL